MVAVRENIQPGMSDTMDESRDCIRRYYGISSKSQLTFLCENQNIFYKIEDSDKGIHLVLRLSKPGSRPLAELQSETVWMNEILRDTGLVIPKPVAGLNGELVQSIPFPGLREKEYPCVLFSFLRGEPPETAGSTASLLPLYTHLGETAAQLHQNVILWSGSDALTRPTLDDAFLLGWNSPFSRFRESCEDPAVREKLDKTAALLGTRLKKFGRAADRFGLIHADLSPSNILIDKNRLSLLDFDDCGFSWFLYDFSAAVSGMEHLSCVPQLRAAWLTGYRKYRKVTRDEERELFTFMMLHRLALLGKLYESPPPQAVSLRRPAFGTFLSQTLYLADRYLSDFA